MNVYRITSPLMGMMLLVSSVYTAGAQNTTKFVRPSWVSAAKPESATDTAFDGASAAVQTNRAAVFNAPPPMRSGLSDLTKTSKQNVYYGVFMDHAAPPDLPAETSDAVVTAIVTNQQPYITEDHTAVFSELLFTPSIVIKDTTHLLQAAKPAVILARGGALKRADGKVVYSNTSGGSSPVDVNVRYLLFLHYLPSSQAFTVTKAWVLTDGPPQELDENGQPYTSVTAASNAATTEDSLVAYVKTKVQGK